jgi:hypothetical protein
LLERDQFVRGFGLLFAGISYSAPWPLAALASAHGPVWKPLPEGIEGFEPTLVDTNTGDFNPSHHYAGLFFLGYFLSQSTPGGFPGAAVAAAVNFKRDENNPPDIALGNHAILHGWAVSKVNSGHLLIPLLIQLALTAK